MPVSGQYVCPRGISLQLAAAADGMLTLSSLFLKAAREEQLSDSAEKLI